eukprot:Skav231603  [mRNA]  locus=scaffold232:439003:443847:+ [translate_table: standard]
MRLVRACFNEPCPVEAGKRHGEADHVEVAKDCQWGEWLSWGTCDDNRFCTWAEWTGECSKSCDARLSTRHRGMVLLPKVENNKCGTPCSGSLHETKTCDSPCNPPVDCELSEWTEWSGCANTTEKGFVGGQRYRERKVTTPPKHGGLACYGDMTQTKACKGDLPEPCNSAAAGQFGSWQSWSDCSTTCGEGYRSRLRAVAKMADAGGQQCNGLLSEVVGCHAGYWEDCGLGKQQEFGGSWELGAEVDMVID